MKPRTFLNILFVTAILSMQIVFPRLHTRGQSGDASPMQPGSYAITPVVRPHDRAPDGGRFFSSQNAFMSGSHALNNNGDVGICSSINAQCVFGAYLISAATQTTLADYCSETALGPFSIIMGANINNQGQAVVGGWTRKDFSSPSVSSIFASSAGALTKVAAIGDMPPPGTAFSGPFTVVMNSEPFGPAINSQGDIAFFGGGQDSSGSSVGGIFVYSADGIRKVIATGDPSPTGGTFDMEPSLSESLHINDSGEVLFLSSVGGTSFGFFLAGPGGVTKLVQSPDRLPNGDSFLAIAGNADLNNHSQVVFPAPLFSGKDSLGLFLYSDGQISQLVATGDPTPIGGQFAFSGFTDKDIQRPKINDNGDIAFSAPITGAAAERAIFVISGGRMVKVVAIGDRLPTGEKIKSLGDFSFNDRDQVSFLAFGKNRPLGIYLATPAQQ